MKNKKKIEANEIDPKKYLGAAIIVQLTNEERPFHFKAFTCSQMDYSNPLQGWEWEGYNEENLKMKIESKYVDFILVGE